MSGGVDSAVAAALLKRAGFEVIGVFMKFWVDDTGIVSGACLPENRCCCDESEQRARKTAMQLGMPFYVIDARREFKKLVVDRFIADAKRGLTPNPCVICNQEIKFGLLVEKALQMGADYVATGHYAQIKKTKDGIYHLFKGRDKNKDQSYFLWRLGQEQLSRIIFPVGCFEKKEVRNLAKKWRLPSAAAPESQEVCFAGGNMEGFLEKYCGKNPGKIINGEGKTIGQHQGLWFYTIGQRKGIKLSGGPFYVAGKNFLKNELVVANNIEVLGKDKAKLSDLKWIAGFAPELSLKIKARIRYRAREVAAILDDTGGLEFKKPQFAVTCGQSAVLYKGQEVLGGGIIE